MKWTRKKNDAWIAGVAAGLAKALDLPVGVVRLIWILALIPTFGMAVLIYVLAVIALPREDQIEAGRQKMILGVCSRIDARGDMEVGLARMVALVLLMATAGTAVVGYIILHFVLNDQKTAPQKVAASE